MDHNSLLGAPAVKASRKGFELDSDGRMVAVGDDESRDEAMSKFLKAFPSVDLVVAWSALCDLRIHSLDDPVLISDSVAAFHWHASFMIKYSKSYEWAGLLRYHFSVAATRSKHGFLPQSWYRQVDQITFNAIGRPLPTRTKLAPAPRNAQAFSLRAATTLIPASNTEQFCMNYAAGRCNGACPFNRLHLCRLCRKLGTRKGTARR